MSDNLKNIKVAEIRKNPSALREVNKTGEEFLGILDSIREYGILNAINVRPYVDPETHAQCYMLIDGLHRFTAACDIGLEEVPCKIIEASDEQVYVLQLIGNVHRKETRPVEYAKQLQRILASDPTLTMDRLAGMLKKSPEWLSQRLGLTALTDHLGKLVDEGQINLVNAYGLSKLPEEEQADWSTRAQTENADVFLPAVQARKRQLDEAARAGRAAGQEVFVAKPYLRKITELSSEISQPTAGPALVAAADLRHADSKTAAAEAGFKLGIEYAMNMDPVSLAEAKKRWHEKTVVARQKREQASQERLNKRASEQRIRANRLEIEVKVRSEGGDVAAALKAFDDANGLVDGKFVKPAEATTAAAE